MTVGAERGEATMAAACPETSEAVVAWSGARGGGVDAAVKAGGDVAVNAAGSAAVGGAEPPAAGPRAGSEASVGAEGENTVVDLARIGWLATVIACLIAVLILVVQGYFGYAGVTLAVAISAAINLT